MKETRIYLIRHGSVENPKDVYYGTLPGFRLSDEGKREVLELAEILRSRGIKFDAIYSSPLDRARETAQLINQERIDINDNVNLSDTHIPLLEGKPLSVLREKGFKNEYGEEFRSQDSETVNNVLDRTNKLIKEVLEKHKGEAVAFVSHGDPIRFILWEFQHPDKEPDVLNLRDEDYPEPAEAIELHFDQNGHFLGFEHIRRKKESNIETLGDRLKEA